MEKYTEAILICSLTMISETMGTPKIFEIVNSNLKGQSLERTDFFRKRITDLNNSFGHFFGEISKRTMELMATYDDSRRPELRDIEFTQNMYSGSVKMIVMLLYANVIGTKGCKELLDICDKCFTSASFELIACGIQILSPGAKIEPHRGYYYGFQTYYIVLQGNRNSFLTVNNQTHTLTAKASVLFGSEMETSMVNGGKEDLILLRCEMVKPMNPLGAMLNTVVLKVMADSSLVKHACNNSWIESE